jgi:hypothetical protein
MERWRNPADAESGELMKTNVGGFNGAQSGQAKRTGP